MLRYGKAMAHRGHMVTLMRQGQQRLLPATEHRNGVEIVTMPRLGGDLYFPKSVRPNDIAARCWHVLRRRYDVHHAFQEFESVALPWLMSRRLKRARLHVYDADDLWVDGGYLKTESDHRGIWRWHYRNVAKIERITRRQSDGMTVVSDFLRNRAIAFGMPTERILLLRPGIETQTLPPATRMAARRRWRLPDDVAVLTFVGFGQQDIGEVLAICAALRHRDIDFRLLMVGPRPLGIEAQLQDLKISDRVTITGALAPDDVAPTLAAADIAILPYPETLLNIARWPTKLSDYLAAGLPTLVGPAGEVGHEVRALGAGERYSFPAEAATFVARWLGHPEALKAMQNNALQAANDQYAIERQAEALESFYSRLMQ